MNLTDPRFWLDFAQSAVLVILWLRKPGQDAATAVRDLENKLDTQTGAMQREIAVLKERVDHMPTDDELVKLEGEVAAINERTVGMAEGMSTVRTQLNRIEQYLLNAKR